MKVAQTHHHEFCVQAFFTRFGDLLLFYFSTIPLNLICLLKSVTGAEARSNRSTVVSYRYCRIVANRSSCPHTTTRHNCVEVVRGHEDTRTCLTCRITRYTILCDASIHTSLVSGTKLKVRCEESRKRRGKHCHSFLLAATTTTLWVLIGVLVVRKFR